MSALAALALFACEHGPGGPVPFAWFEGYAVASAVATDEVGDTGAERIPASVLYDAYADDDGVLHAESGGCASGPHLDDENAASDDRISIETSLATGDIELVAATRWTGEGVSFRGGEPDWNATESTWSRVDVESALDGTALLQVDGNGVVDVIEEAALLDSGEERWLFGRELAGTWLEEELRFDHLDERRIRTVGPGPCCSALPPASASGLLALGLLLPLWGRRSA